MSRSYAIRLPLNILLAPAAREKLGSFSMTFKLMEILPVEQMRELLRKTLLDMGFVESDQGLAMPCKNGNSAVFDAETMTIHLRVPVPDNMEVRVIDDNLPEWADHVDEAVASGELLNPALTKLAQQNLGREAAAALNQVALEARSQINAALKQTYREAIKEKAAKLGSVSNISESNDGSTYRIRIEVCD